MKNVEAKNNKSMPYVFGYDETVQQLQFAENAGYVITEDGKVFNKYKKQLVAYTVTYAAINICNNGIRQFRNIHRLVAAKYVANPKKLPYVNHKDGNKLNNHFSNLEWCTAAENSQHAHDYGLMTYSRFWKGKTGSMHGSAKPVLQLDLDGNVLAEFGSIKTAHESTGIDLKTIRHSIRGKQTRKFLWKYKIESNG